MRQAIRDFFTKYSPAAIIGMAFGLALATTSGFLAATALGIGEQETRTVTINIPTGVTGSAGPPGPQGPEGPAGPRGPAGLECPAAFTAGVLVINAPGGQARLWTCLAN